MAVLEKIKEENSIATIEVKVLDSNGIQCLDAANWVRFGLTGDGMLEDNLGTSGGSRLVQLYNGRATISMHTKGGASVISAKVETLPVVFMNVK